MVMLKRKTPAIPAAGTSARGTGAPSPGKPRRRPAQAEAVGQQAAQGLAQHQGGHKGDGEPAFQGNWAASPR